MHPGVNSEKMFGWGSYWGKLLGEATEVSTVFKRFEQLYDEEPQFTSSDIFQIKHVRPFGWAVILRILCLVAIGISSLSLMIYHYLWRFIIISDDERINVYSFIYAIGWRLLQFFKLFLLTACAKIWLVFEHLETLCGIYDLV